MADILLTGKGRVYSTARNEPCIVEWPAMSDVVPQVTPHYVSEADFMHDLAAALHYHSRLTEAIDNMKALLREHLKEST